MVLMNEFVVYVGLVLLGACLGSFAGATVWRLRAKQLKTDKANKEPYDKKEYGHLKKLLGKKTLEDRSQCLHCGYELKWYDLIPVVSWLSLRGRCRSCKHKIGAFELVIELAMIAFVVGSYVFWPGGVQTGLEITHFALWIAAGLAMAILFAYDLKWFLLPDVAVVALGVIGLGIVGVTIAETQAVTATLLSTLGAVGVLGGLYAFLFLVSGGRWVGFGDVKLGIVLGLLLVQWELATIALFFANFIGCLIVIPLLATKKLERTSHIPFGPLLIAGAVVAWFSGEQIITLYLASMGIS
jgi:leader peptidase (prepilin peptidase)/N-methyltransferase